MRRLRTILGLPERGSLPRAPVEHAVAKPGDLASTLVFLNTVARACAGAATCEAATRQCLRIVAEFTGWSIAHAYRRSADGGSMRSMRLWYFAPSLDARSADIFVAASERIVFSAGKGFGQGLIGRVATEGRALSYEDVTEVSDYLRAEAARVNALRGCFAFPVRLNDRTEIVLEFFSPHKAELRGDLLELMAYVADRLAITMAEQARRARIGTLMQALDEVATHLARTTANVETGARVVRTMAEDIDVSRSNVDRVSSDVSREIAQVADAAETLQALTLEASSRASQIEAIAEGTAGTLKEAVRVFNDLQAKIAGVGKISNLIGVIASQTNLLALNATIEAARAGDAGRGFSVVASEVKELAKSVSSATDEIATQIERLTQVAAQSTGSLSRIHGEIEAVQRTATDITRVSASHHAASGSIAARANHAQTTIKEAVRHLDALRATTAEALASSQSLESTSGQLHDQGRELSKASQQLAGTSVASKSSPDPE